MELTIDLMAPGRGDRSRAEGHVVRSGRTLTVCQAEVVAVSADGDEAPVAVMRSTVTARADVTRS